MTVFHIILRHLALIYLSLFREEIDCEAFLAGSANFEDILYHRIERSCPNTSKHGFCKEVDTQFYLSAFSPILFIGADEPAVWFQDCW